MLDLQLSDEQVAVRDLARSVGLELLDPAARDAEEARVVSAAVWDRLFATGLTTAVPDTLTALLAVEGLSYGDAGIALAAIWSGAPALLLSSCGTPAQQEEFLPSLSGDRSRRAGVALYEGFGRAPSEYQTTIAAAGPGQWRVTGRKVAVPFGADAAPLVVIGNDPSGRLRAVLLSASDPGVDVAARPEHGHLALDAAPTYAVEFDAPVAEERLLGGSNADGDGLAVAVGRLRLYVAAAALGCASRSVDYAAAYANERVAFGKPLSAFQGVSFLLAEAAVQIEASRLDLWSAAVVIDDARTDGLERAVGSAVNYTCQVAAGVTRDALQVLGGHGFIRDHPVERWYRTAATLSAFDCDPTYSTFAPAL